MTEMEARNAMEHELLRESIDGDITAQMELDRRQKEQWELQRRREEALAYEDEAAACELENSKSYDSKSDIELEELPFSFSYLGEHNDLNNDCMYYKKRCDGSIFQLVSGKYCTECGKFDD